MVEDGHDAMVADVAQGFVAVVKNFYKSLLCNQFQSSKPSFKLQVLPVSRSAILSRESVKD